MAYARKAIVAAVTALVAALTTALLDGHLDKIELIGVALAGIAAGVAVYAVPNEPKV